MKTKKQQTGAWGEEQAASFLLQKGYEVTDRNFSIPKKGEIDIIAWHEKPYHGRTLCFVEVKTREKNDGSAERAVGKKKMTALKFVAWQYCLKHGINIDHTPIQFEQVSIVFVAGKTEVAHYEIPAE